MEPKCRSFNSGFVWFSVLSPSWHWRDAKRMDPSVQSCSDWKILQKRRARLLTLPFPALAQLALDSGYLLLGNVPNRNNTRQHKSEIALVCLHLHKPKILTRCTAHWYFPSSFNRERKKLKYSILRKNVNELWRSVYEAMSLLSRNIVFSHICICLLSPLPYSFSIITNSFVQWKGLRKLSKDMPLSVCQASLQSQCSTSVLATQGRNFSRGSYQRMLLYRCSNSSMKTHLGQTAAVLSCNMFSMTYDKHLSCIKWHSLNPKKVFHTEIHRWTNGLDVIPV